VKRCCVSLAAVKPTKPPRCRWYSHTPGPSSSALMSAKLSSLKVTWGRRARRKASAQCASVGHKCRCRRQQCELSLRHATCELCKPILRVHLRRWFRGVRVDERRKTRRDSDSSCRRSTHRDSLRRLVVQVFHFVQDARDGAGRELLRSLRAQKERGERSVRHTPDDGRDRAPTRSWCLQHTVLIFTRALSRLAPRLLAKAHHVGARWALPNNQTAT
jgi:hypothetical protein